MLACQILDVKSHTQNKSQSKTPLNSRSRNRITSLMRTVTSSCQVKRYFVLTLTLFERTQSGLYTTCILWCQLADQNDTTKFLWPRSNLSLILSMACSVQNFCFTGIFPWLPVSQWFHLFRLSFNASNGHWLVQFSSPSQVQKKTYKHVCFFFLFWPELSLYPQ